MRNLSATTISSVLLASVLCITIAGTANAVEDPTPPPDAKSESWTPMGPTSLPVVTSEAGISAIQIAPAGASDEEIDFAIAMYEKRAQAQKSSLSAVDGGVTTYSTGNYYSYCQEGTSGMLIWTGHPAESCPGWHYQYLDGRRLSKINMLRLLANNSYPYSVPDLNAWCSHNSFYCTVAVASIWGIIGLLD